MFALTKLYTRRCKANLNQLFITRRKNAINLYIILTVNKKINVKKEAYILNLLKCIIGQASR